MLKKAADSLKSSLRKIDTVARFGGDEFLILINNLNAYDDIVTVMEKLMLLFRKPFDLEGQNFFICATSEVRPQSSKKNGINGLRPYRPHRRH